MIKEEYREKKKFTLYKVKSNKNLVLMTFNINYTFNQYEILTRN